MNEEVMLTEEEFAVLDEALDAWVERGAAGKMMGSLLGALFSKDDPVLKAKMEEDERKREEEHKAKVAKSKRIATLLKAKLYSLQAAGEAAAAIERVRG